ncbi:hypothetical protein LZ575_16435 [Antarcticibacterium sp. 1MA-6-2]|uniref:ligand-binding sensor domain-containing protein n=1 Tax=Antarcticibacterium sp. 1MA-6-2 TaxID=2908210 RepID=UPI001F44B7F2|nr:two-component regulator propeller domain-containing protein [Antarcticibacterium sp. 1MA-6-2]UJH90407.1 hypothetical protein LZ575_16435 [Antarcticibacterium sp. 1MA-6-2]
MIIRTKQRVKLLEKNTRIIKTKSNLILIIGKLFLFVFIPHSALGQDPIPYFQNFTAENGLPDNRISTVIQDKQGLLWVGTRFGINRYDGREAISYPLPGEPRVEKIFLDKEGTLWVGTSKGLFFYNGRTDLFEIFTTGNQDFDSVLHSNIVEVFQASNGKIWFSNRIGQLAFFIPGLEKNQKIYNIRSNPVNLASWALITAIEEDNQGYLWLGSNVGDIRLFDATGEKFIKTEFENSFLGSHINDIALDTTNQMWIATNDNGVFKFMLDSGDAVHYIQRGKHLGNSINNNIVLCLLVDSNNNVWMGTDGGGLNLYRAERDEFIYFKRRGGTEASLSDNSILSITQGLHNIIWLGTVHGGITYFKNNLSIQNIPPEKLSFNADRQGSRIFEDSRGNFWISAGRDGLRKYNPATGKISLINDTDHPTGYSGKIVLSIMEDSFQRLWIGTLYEGINVYDLKKEKFLEVPGSRDLNGVLAIEEQENGIVWVGSDTGIRIYNPSLDIVNDLNTQSGEGLSNNVVTSIYRDAKGDMWVGTINGLNVFPHNQESFQTFFSVKDDNSTLSSNHILSISEGPDLSVWVGTYGFGANRFFRSTEKFHRINKEDGLAGNIVQGVLMDHSENIWLSTNLGLSRVGAEGITNYGNKEGVPPFNGSSVSISKNGRMFFAGEKGLFHFRPEELKTDTIAPRPFFSSTQVLRKGGVKEIAFGDLNNRGENTRKISIEPDDKSMLVFFGSSNFWNPEKNNYAYRLKGLSEEWHNIGLQQSLSFSNLPPNEYTLEVRVANELGKWSPYIASLDFMVLPSFWQKTEIQILGFLLLISAILFFIKWRSNY